MTETFRPHEVSITDGGKKEQGFEHERKDCTVRCLAILLDIPYAQAHERLAKLGRRDKHGWHFGEKTVTKDFGLVPQPWLLGGSTQKVVDKLPAKGRFAIVLNDHVFAVVDGVAHDSFLPEWKRRPKMVYKYEKPVAQ